MKYQKEYCSKTTSFRNLDFAAGNPNGGQKYNIATFYIEDKKLRDWNPEKRFCVSCMGLKNTTYTLRGICKDSLLGNDLY